MKKNPNLMVLLLSLIALTGCYDKNTDLEVVPKFQEMEEVSYSKIFDDIETASTSKFIATDSEIEEITKLLEVENPSTEEIEKALRNINALNSEQQALVYEMIALNELASLKKEGEEISEEEILIKETFSTVKKANEIALSKYGKGIYKIGISEAEEIFSSLSNETEIKSYCPVESFPRGFGGVTPRRYASAYSNSKVKNNPSERVCDDKIWFGRRGYAWYSTRSSVTNAIFRAYGGVLNHQNNRHMISGVSMYRYGIFPSTLRKRLKIAY